MAKRNIIVLGDRTTHGGTVISAWGQDGGVPMTINGKPVACVGDYVYCPKCRGTHQVIEGAENPPMELNGRQIAVEGCSVSDGSKLLSVGQARAVHSSEGKAAAAMAAAGAAAATAAAIAAASQSGGQGSGAANEGEGKSEEAEEYTAQYVIIDESTGKPVEFEYAYCIKVDDGEEFVDKPTNDTAETRLVQRSKEVAVEMLPPIQLQIGV